MNVVQWLGRYLPLVPSQSTLSPAGRCSRWIGFPALTIFLLRIVELEVEGPYPTILATAMELSNPGKFPLQLFHRRVTPKHLVWLVDDHLPDI